MDERPVRPPSSETDPSRETDSEESFDSTLTSVVRELGAEARASMGSHPDPDALIRYSQGEMDEEEASSLRGHLESCADCARAVLDLGSLARFEATPEASSPEEIDAALRLFEQRVVEKIGRRSEPTPAAPPPPSRAQAAPLRWMVPVAAALLLALLLLFRFAGGDSAPAPNVHVASLTPVADALTRQEGSLSPLVVPASAQRFVLILNLVDSSPFSRYLLEVLSLGDSTGSEREIWSSDALQRTATGNFTVEFDRDFLAPGRYLLRISGLDTGDPVVLASYAVELTYE